MGDIRISVYCLAYNCVKFIDKSIKGMLNQNVNVDYKIIIHDDASTDGTAEIIKKYAEIYPQKIYAILQSENQYSKGVSIYKQYIEPNIEGDYIAVCEGDDYWIDNDKLQLQYDYMENNPSCSLCTHNTEKYNLETKKGSSFNNWKDVHVLNADEVFLDYRVHTSSYFIRKDCKDWPGKRYWFGDYVVLTWAFFRGQIVSLPKTMSVYNYKNPNGVTKGIYYSNIARIVSTKKEQTQYLNEYNILTKYKYDSYIQKAIKNFSFQTVALVCNNIILNSSSQEKIIHAVKEVISHDYYKEYIKNGNRKGVRRWLIRCKYEGYVIYPLWKIIMRAHLKRITMR